MNTMNTHSEKHSALSEDVTQSIQQLKLDAEHATLALAQYEEDPGLPSGSTQTYREVDIRRMIDVIANTSVNTPARMLQKLNRHLRRLVRRSIFKIRQGFGTVPRLLLGDVIRFEDALGRRAHLPYQYFKEWILMKKFLIHTFMDLPGEYQVNRDLYCITFGKARGYVNGRNWRNAVHPGERVSMSIVLTKPSSMTKQLACPRCGFTTRCNKKLDNLISCDGCNNSFEVRESFPQISIRPSDGAHNRISLLAKKCHALFMKRREESGPLKPHKEESSTSCIPSMANDKLNNSFPRNAGLSQLKHILLHYTNDPLEIIETIESLIFQAATSSPSTTSTLSNNTIDKLQTTLALIHNEATRKHELNYFDMHREHKKFMSYCTAMISSFETYLIPAHAETERDRLKSSIDDFTSWTQSHYPVPCISISNTNSLFNVLHPRASDTLVLLKTVVDKLICLRCPTSTTILQLKETVQKSEGLPCHMQYLVCRGRKLDDRSTVAQCELGPTHYVYVLLPIWKI